MAKQKKTSKIAETFGDHIVFYDMAKDFFIDDLTDKDLPAKERVPKAAAKRLALNVKEVTVTSFDKPGDECIYIRFKIRGSEKDIDLVNKVFKARYGSEEK